MIQKRYSALLIEDNPICQQSQKFILEANGFRVDIVGTAKEAILALNRIEEKYNYINYDLIIVDFQLPDMWGDHLVDVIRLTERGDAYQKKLVIIAVMARTDQLCTQRMCKSGVNHVVKKPMSQQDLVHVMPIINAE